MYKLDKLHNDQIQVSTSMSSQKHHVYGNIHLPWSSVSMHRTYSTILLSRHETPDGQGLFFFLPLGHLNLYFIHFIECQENENQLTAPC